MTTLDDTIGSYLPFDHVDLLKLDVEGYEMGALRGAEGLLASGPIFEPSFFCGSFLDSFKNACNRF